MTTGLFFDLPHGRWMDDVLRIRSLHEPARLRFPIEITVAGSSGQGKAELLRQVGAVAQGFAPFTFQFGSVARFSGSSVYYLSPREARRFHEFQDRLARCGLRFEPVPFSYVPHCTIAILPEDAAESAHAEVMACTVPDHDIRISVDAPNQQCRQEERIPLGS